MEIEEHFSCRSDILNDSKDQDGFIVQQDVLSQILPYMLDAKLVDSEDFNDVYYINQVDALKVNGYATNESGERLQLFLLDENCIDEISLDKVSLYEEWCVSNRSDYEKQFKRTSKFVTQAIKGQLAEKIQDADPVKALVSQLSSPEGIEQFDVIEIFLITLTATVSFKSTDPQPRTIHFEEDKIEVSYTKSGENLQKEMLLLRRVIDLNFISNVNTSRGNREPLVVNFQKTFKYSLEVIQAANETKFESYLCVLRADVLFDLYRHYSSRLLEKNVRSFLQFVGANKGLRETIRDEPEKFIAYNNGLTITATHAQVFTRKKLLYIESLEDFQIVNGGQTTASIYFAKKDGLDISKVKVMAKINVMKKSSDSTLDELISSISKYSNTQSRVSNVDLRSRNPQLVKLKTLSNSVVTPSGMKWFFERAKGEFKTSIRMAGKNNIRVKKEFPPERRFSKELLGKYYSAWGEVPHLVKKGGEKIFRHFIEVLSPNSDTEENIEIDRQFYEDLISKIILFRQMEKIYGQGKSSMGQLRSAVIPYTLSILFIHTDGCENGGKLDMGRIWKNEGLEDDLVEYLSELLMLTNELIKKYSLSDDYGEYSKKPELWSSIKNSSELKNFMATENSVKLLKKYSI